MKFHQLRPRTLRTLSLLGLFLCAVTVLGVRLVQLQVFQHESWTRLSEQNHVSKRTLEMKRGAITDRLGNELALSVETYTVFVFTREAKSLPDLATVLSTVLPMSREEILQKISSRKGYLPVFKNLDRSLAQKLQELDLPGVVLEENYRRFYPQGALASNILGFCGTDGHGLEGLELSYNKSLRGYAGLAVQEDVSLGEGPPRMRIVQPPMGGNNLVLTIDSFIQHIIEGELAKLMEKYHPVDATAIAMDPQTGEILGMGCLPNYDLNDFASSTPDTHRNRPAVDFFEPGSCMKIFAAACGLTSGRLNMSSRFYCKGFGEVSGRRIKCHGAHALVGLEEAIAESCNASMVQISQIIESRELYRTYRQLGFGEPTGLEVPSESSGMLAPPSRWSGLSAASLCIGQEMAATGLQLVAAYSAIANGGWLLQPRLVKKLVSQQEDNIEEMQPLRKRQVFSPQLAHRLRRLLLGVVETGTGKLAQIEDYTVGGKTSTAQKANPRGGYYSDKLVTSFIGMAPIDDPKIVLLVAVNEPKGEENILFGGKVTAPTFSIILDRILKYMKVPPDRKPLSASISPPTFLASADPGLKASGDMPKPPQPAASASRIQLLDKGPPLVRAEIATGPVVPDLRGLSLREVAQLVKPLEVKALFEGNGLAVDQVPPPGSFLSRNQTILVKFSPHGSK